MVHMLYHRASKKCCPNIPLLSSFLCVFFSDSGAWWDIQLPWPIANANGLTGHFATLCLHDIEDTLLFFTTSYFHNHTHEKYSVLKGKKHDIGYQLSNGQGGLIITIKNPIEMLLCSAERRDRYDWSWFNCHHSRRRGNFPCDISFVHASMNKDQYNALFVALRYERSTLYYFSPIFQSLWVRHR